MLLMRYLQALAVLSVACAVPADDGVIGPRESSPGIFCFHSLDGRGNPFAGVDNPDVAGGALIVFWNEVEPREADYDWSAIDRELQGWSAHGKKLDLIFSTVHELVSDTPRWVFDDHGVRCIARGYWSGFESGLGGYVLLEGRANEGGRSCSESLLVGVGRGSR